jgi:hypothetical protein
MDYIKELVKHLDRIAEANKDEFRYSIQIETTPQGAVLYSFDAREAADGHSFLCDNGDTPEFAAHYAHKHLKEACKSWGYKYVE